MGRKIRGGNLESREARRRLPVNAKPYYRTIGRGLHLGYRKGKVVGRWVVRLYRGDGSYAVETIGTADDFEDADGIEFLDFWQAQEAARVRQQSLADTAGTVGRYTVKRAIADYVEHLDGRASQYDVDKRLAASVPASLADKEVTSLTTDDIAKWHRALAKQAPRLRTRKNEKQRHRDVDMGDPETIRQRRVSANRILASLKAALNLAWRNGKVPSDGAWRRVKPFRGADSARVRYLTIAEAKRLVNAAQGEFRALVQAALQTGCRYGELCALKVEDFNPDAGTLAIRTSKSGKSRHVVLTDEGAEFFAQLTAGRSGAAVMLTRDGRDWHKSEQIDRIKVACERAKIDPPISFHGLRHTWASLSVMAGVPLLVVAKNLGHADTRMVEKHYGHLAPSYVADAIRAAAPRFGTVGKSSIRRMRTKA